MTGHPTLVVVSGPPGAGKTTLAHLIARMIGCPAVCRDEIKEGMVHAAPGFAAAPDDELTARALPTFFSVLELLLAAGTTTIAEAAFQHRLWQPGLEPLRELARIRLIHCSVSPEVAWLRREGRRAGNPLRRAHADEYASDAQAQARAHLHFERLSLDEPTLEVDTTNGYRPGTDEIVAFVNRTR